MKCPKGFIMVNSPTDNKTKVPFFVKVREKEILWDKDIPIENIKNFLDRCFNAKNIIPLHTIRGNLNNWEVSIKPDGKVKLEREIKLKDIYLNVSSCNLNAPDYRYSYYNEESLHKKGYENRFISDQSNMSFLLELPFMMSNITSKCTAFNIDKHYNMNEDINSATIYGEPIDYPDAYYYENNSPKELSPTESKTFLSYSHLKVIFNNPLTLFDPYPSYSGAYDNIGLYITVEGIYNSKFELKDVNTVDENHKKYPYTELNGNQGKYPDSQSGVVYVEISEDERSAIKYKTHEPITPNKNMCYVNKSTLKNNFNITYIWNGSKYEKTNNRIGESNQMEITNIPL